MPEIPNLGKAAGFGIIGFGLSYVVMLTAGMDTDYPADVAVGAIVTTGAWLVLTLRKNGQASAGKKP